MTPRRRDRAFDYGEYRPRLPGPSAPRAAGRRPFGATWWGRAWVDALEHRARLDSNRLPRGRTYARAGAVGALRLAPGTVTAPVQGSRATPYTVTVRVRTFDGGEWARLYDALAAEIGHTAALLDGELPPEVAGDATGVGLDLLPGPGDIQPRCTCPDHADPCKHAAAVCYLVADEVDRDPFGLLLLRGRDRDEVLGALRARRGSVAAEVDAVEAVADPGVPARQAWARRPDPAPFPPLPPEHHGRPPALPAEAPPGGGVDAAGLRRLALDAAARALDLALGSPASGLELDADQDLARRAARALAPDHRSAEDELAVLAARSGVPARDLWRRGVAWREGGAGALAVLDGSWDPGKEAVATGLRLLGPGAVARRNRVTLGRHQVRLGPDGCWYPFRKAADGGWEADGPALWQPGDDGGDPDADGLDG